MRSIVAIVSAALFAAAVTGSALAASVSSIHHQGVVKVEKHRNNLCKHCKTN